MSQSNFSRPGAIDLSGLRKPAGAAPGGGEEQDPLAVHTLDRAARTELRDGAGVDFSHVHTPRAY